MDTKDKGDNFFVSLRKICRNVEKGVGDLQSDHENMNIDHNPATAIATVTNKKKEAQSLRREIQAKTEHLHETGQALDELLLVCNKFINNTHTKVAKIEVYMKQYGYTKIENKPTSQQTIPQEEVTKERERTLEDAELESCSTPKRKSLDDACHGMPKTPKLEDFGISEYTLGLMRKGTIQKPHPPKEEFSYSSTSYTKGDMNETVPSIFQHNGVLVTPSTLLGKSISFNSPGTQELKEGLTGAWYNTPADQRKHVGNHDDNIPTYNTDYISTTPQSPELMTPSVKKLMASSKKIQHIEVDRHAKFGEPPVFATPNLGNVIKPTTKGPQKLSDNSASPFFPSTVQRSKCTGTPPRMSNLELPQTPKSPELTSQFFYPVRARDPSGQDTSQYHLTVGTHKVTDMSLSHPTVGTHKVTDKRNNTPHLHYSTNQPLQDAPQNIKLLTGSLYSNTTPESPVMLTQTFNYKQLSQQHKDSGISKPSKLFISTTADTPESPKLLRSYKTLHQGQS